MQPLGILPLYFPDIFENYLRFSFCISFPLTLVFLPSFICKFIFSHISRGFSLLTWLAPPPPPPQLGTNPPIPGCSFCSSTVLPLCGSHDRVHAGPADQQQPPALHCCRWWKQPQLFGFRNDLFVFVQCTYIMCKTVLMYIVQLPKDLPYLEFTLKPEVSNTNRSFSLFVKIWPESPKNQVLDLDET